jgi:hypothetical protein
LVRRSARPACRRPPVVRARISGAHRPITRGTVTGCSRPLDGAAIVAVGELATIAGRRAPTHYAQQTLARFTLRRKGNCNCNCNCNCREYALQQFRRLKTMAWTLLKQWREAPKRMARNAILPTIPAGGTHGTHWVPVHHPPPSRLPELGDLSRRRSSNSLSHPRFFSCQRRADPPKQNFPGTGSQHFARFYFFLGAFRSNPLAQCIIRGLLSPTDFQQSN